MKVLSVASELYPLVKTGGLADVTGALPLALARHGVQVRTLLPGYPSVMANLARTKKLLGYTDLFGQSATVRSGTIGELDLLVLDSPGLFDRSGGPYGDAKGHDWPDNWRRFAALSRVAADIAQGKLKAWQPDIVHAHDWQPALSLAYMRYGPAHGVPKVLTIHNLAFQGNFGPEVFAELGLPSEAWALDGIEYYGRAGFLKAGLTSANAITTVSPTYAHEILFPENGMGLDGLISERADHVHGILNGIDIDIWNPAEDHMIARSFSARKLHGRMANRRALEEHFGLDQDDAPLFIVVSRLTWQKGMDMLVQVLDDLVGMGAKLAVLGSGDQFLEGGLLAAAERHRGRIAVQIGYDEPLSHLMQAGGDAIVIPSRFEPCGLTQLYALRYGCVPVVSRVGGLADTVIDANEAALSAAVATGVVFGPLDPLALVNALKRTIGLYAEKPVWQSIQRGGMRADFSWHRSAEKYAALYHSLADSRAAKN